MKGKSTLREEPKILVGTTAASHKEYVLNKFLKRVSELTYPDFDFTAVVSQKDTKYGEEMERRSMFMGFNNIRILIDAYAVNPRIRVATHHNMLRREFLLKDYDYLFILDQDIIPPEDIIETLLETLRSTNSDVVTGVYKLKKTVNKKRVNSLWYKSMELTDNKLQAIWLEDGKLNNGTIKWDGGFATGCCLASRDALEKTYFKTGQTNKVFHDGVWWNDLANANIDVYVNTNAICEHYPNDWGDILKEELHGSTN